MQIAYTSVLHFAVCCNAVNTHEFSDTTHSHVWPMLFQHCITTRFQFI